MRDKRHTEYGGGPGSPSRLETGQGRPLTAAERARITRQEMLRNLPSATTPRVRQISNAAGVISTEALPYDVEQIKDLRDKTNGYAQDGVDHGDTVA